MLALSTAWNANRLTCGKTIAGEIFNLGIKNIELNFSLTEKMVEEIFKFCASNDMRVVSLHNFCPIPKGLSRQDALPDCFSLASLDEQERLKAVTFTKITIDTAQKTGAKAVVLHCGRVEMEDQTRNLISMLKNGGVKNEFFQKMASTFIEERRKKSPPHVKQLLKSLAELCEYAEKSKCVLGLENRFYFREIPSFEELEIIFDKIKSSRIRYWHDVGHAYIFERLGFLENDSLLKRFSPKLSGIHIHDIKNLEDHQAPLKGEFDFKRLIPYVKKETIKVVEAHACATAEDVKKSISYLGGLWP